MPFGGFGYLGPSDDFVDRRRVGRPRRDRSKNRAQRKARRTSQR